MPTCLSSTIQRRPQNRTPYPEAMDFQIIEAEDGEQALDACKRAMPGASCSTGNMPVMDGYEFLGHLRRMPGGDAPKVVFCTTENGIDHISRALQAGANEYIMKPFDKDIIADKSGRSAWSRLSSRPRSEILFTPALRDSVTPPITNTCVGF